MTIHIHIISAEIDNPIFDVDEDQTKNIDINEVEDIRGIVYNLKVSMKDDPELNEGQDQSHIMSCIEEGWFLVKDKDGNILYNPSREMYLTKKAERLYYLNSEIDRLFNEAKGIGEIFSDLSKDELLDKSNEEINNQLSSLESEYEHQTTELSKKKEELESELTKVSNKLESLKGETEKKKDKLEESRKIVSEYIVEYVKQEDKD